LAANAAGSSGGSAEWSSQLAFGGLGRTSDEQMAGGTLGMESR